MWANVPNVDNTVWQTAPAMIPACAENTVHIWLVLQRQSQAVVDALQPYLSQDEKQRAAKYHTADLRNRYIVRRAALRHMLSHYLEITPAAIEFAYGEWDKPYLSGANLHFNLSHSGDLAIIGISQSQPLGIDIEVIQSLSDLALVAQRHFSLTEQADLFTLSHDKQIVGFYNCWTRKEAFIKADGRGLAIALDSFDVTLLPDDLPRIFRIGDKHDDPDWTLLDLPVPDGYCGSLAIHQPIHQIFTWLW